MKTVNGITFQVVGLGEYSIYPAGRPEECLKCKRSQAAYLLRVLRHDVK